MSIPIFHTQTPYHFFLAMAVAGESEPREAWWIPVTMHESQAAFVSDATKIASEVFSRVVHLVADGSGRRLRAMGNRRTIERLVASLDAEVDLYTSNIQTVEGMLLATSMLGRVGRGSVHLVEDGLSTYEKTSDDLAQTIEDSMSGSSSVTRLVRRLWMGAAADRRLDRIPVASLDGVHVSHPAAMDTTIWKQAEISAIPFGTATRSRLGDLARSMAGGTSLPDRLIDVTALVLLPHSAKLSASTPPEALASMLGELHGRSGGAVGLKYHPREKSRYLDGAPGMDELTTVEIPAEIPGELCMLLAPSLERVVTGATSALVSAPLFAPTAKLTLLAGSGIDDAVLDRLRRAVDFDIATRPDLGTAS